MDCTRLLAPVTGVFLLTMALSKLHSARLSVPVVSDKPHHPTDFAFPSQKFGKKNPTKHSFQARWFNSGSGYITMKRTVLLAASIT